MVAHLLKDYLEGLSDSLLVFRAVDVFPDDLYFGPFAPLSLSACDHGEMVAKSTLDDYESQNATLTIDWPECDFSRAYVSLQKTGDGL